MVILVGASLVFYSLVALGLGHSKFYFCPVLFSTENLPSLPERKNEEKKQNKTNPNEKKNFFVFCFLTRRAKTYPPSDGRQIQNLECPYAIEAHRTDVWILFHGVHSTSDYHTPRVTISTREWPNYEWHNPKEFSRNTIHPSVCPSIQNNLNILPPAWILCKDQACGSYNCIIIVNAP